MNNTYILSSNCWQGILQAVEEPRYSLLFFLSEIALVILYINDVNIPETPKIVLYADDTNVFSSSKDLAVLVRDVNIYLQNLSQWLTLL